MRPWSLLVANLGYRRSEAVALPAAPEAGAYFTDGVQLYRLETFDAERDVVVLEDSHTTRRKVLTVQKFAALKLRRVTPDVSEKV